ncbi:MAG: hypothetical protein ACYC1M_06220 [Armatimonadota bacterium]
MSWSIFGRLFWKVWREDWKRWASVLAVGVAVMCIAWRYINVSGIPILIIYMSSFMAAIRGKRDAHSSDTATGLSKLPSIVLITMWSCFYTIFLVACSAELHRGSLTHNTAFMMLWLVSASMVGYGLGMWSHPWFPATVTTLPFIPSFFDYVGYSNTPPYQPTIPALGITNIVMVSVVIAVLSVVVITRVRKHMPTILQLVLTLCLVWAFAIGVQKLLGDDGEYLGRYGHHITVDRSLEVTQKPEGVATLSDYRTGRSYQLKITRWGDWDRVFPLGIHRRQFVSAIALNSKKDATSIIRWNYKSNDISTITTINRNRYTIDPESSSYLLSISCDDNRYLLLRLTSNLGQGYDYMVIDIPTRTTKLIMANEITIYEMGFRSLKIATFFDERRRTARILSLESMRLGPVIKWTGEDNR